MGRAGEKPGRGDRKKAKEGDLGDPWDTGPWVAGVGAHSKEHQEASGPGEHKAPRLGSACGGHGDSGFRSLMPPAETRSPGPWHPASVLALREDPPSPHP